VRVRRSMSSVMSVWQLTGDVSVMPYAIPTSFAPSWFIT
jgi:hypothetical protein